MKPPDVVPDAVIESIARRHVVWVNTNPHHASCRDDWPWEQPEWTPLMGRFEGILKELRWSGDHYSFNFAGIYVGIELDGYMHT